MAAMANDTRDSNIYENTDFMPESGTTEAEMTEVNTHYESLDMGNGNLSEVTAAVTSTGRCGGRWWIVVVALMRTVVCIWLSLLTVWVAGTMWDKAHAGIDIQDKKMAAFSVYPSARTFKLCYGCVVPFDTVIEDSMDAFNKSEHFYTCPATGTYFFSLCINNGPIGSDISVEVGGSIIMEVYSYNNDDDIDVHLRAQGCNAAVCKCSVGSRVLARGNRNITIAGRYRDPRSILSGFLLYPE